MRRMAWTAAALLALGAGGTGCDGCDEHEVVLEVVQGDLFADFTMDLVRSYEQLCEMRLPVPLECPNTGRINKTVASLRESE